MEEMKLLADAINNLADAINAHSGLKSLVNGNDEINKSKINVTNFSNEFVTLMDLDDTNFRKFKILNQLWGKDTRELKMELSTRAYNGILRNGIHTLGHLASLSEKKILKSFKHVGKDCVEEYKKALFRNGLKFNLVQIIE